MANYLKLLIRRNDLTGIEYVEPFAGGASVALGLLFDEYVSHVTINDLNAGVAAFWRFAVSDGDELCRRIMNVPLTVREWQRQRAVYQDSSTGSADLAFATFYLNRTNRSGIIARGGVIGGLQQDGPWKMDARFQREELCRRILKVGRFSSRITVAETDASALLAADQDRTRDALYYLDPPYFVKGARLYDNFFTERDHAALRDLVIGLESPWVVSYDAAPEICALYCERRRVNYTLGYSASSTSAGAEVMFFSDGLRLPDVRSPAGVRAADMAGLG